MPKQPKKLSSRLTDFVTLFPCLKTDGKVLFCQLCNKPISSEKLFCVKQHVKSATHIANSKRKEEKSAQQQFLEESLGTSKVEVFNKELCEAFVGADIPLFKVNNRLLKNFMEKYINFKIPSETTLRRNITSLYESKLEHIRRTTKGEFLWMSIDETTDPSGRHIANVVVGLLNCDTDENNKTFLLNVAVLQSANHSTIARLFDDSANLLGDESKDKILLLLSDAAPYMVKAADGISVFYPKVVHVTCLAHGLHRVCETIRGLYPLADSLVAEVKKIFLKAPEREHFFRNMCNLPLPPKPILTRWGTWIEAVSYYAQNFETIEGIVNALDCEDAHSIKKAQHLFKNAELKQQIIFIHVNFGCLPKYIQKLENSHMALVNAVDIVQEAQNQVESAGVDVVILKFKSVLLKNKGFLKLQNVANYFKGRRGHAENDNGFTVAELTSLKFAPITSVDTERTFSMYKNFYRDNRHAFTFENMKENFIIYCNNNMK